MCVLSFCSFLGFFCILIASANATLGPVISAREPDRGREGRTLPKEIREVCTRGARHPYRALPKPGGGGKSLSHCLTLSLKPAAPAGRQPPTPSRGPQGPQHPTAPPVPPAGKRIFQLFPSRHICIASLRRKENSGMCPVTLPW